MKRLRVQFTKHGKVRWISHRDIARAWERAIRRTGLQLAYTEGFSPRPKMSFGLALPTGAESDAEYLDLELAAPGHGLELAVPGRAVDLAALSDALPVGIDCVDAAWSDGEPSLQEDVVACGWRFALDAAYDRNLVRERVAEFFAATSCELTIERKGGTRRDDARPLVDELKMVDDDVVAVVRVVPWALRPSELLNLVALEPSRVLVRRTHQWREREGRRIEPLTRAPERDVLAS